MTSGRFSALLHWTILLAALIAAGLLILSSPAVRFPVTVIVVVSAAAVFGFIFALQDYFEADDSEVQTSDTEER